MRRGVAASIAASTAIVLSACGSGGGGGGGDGGGGGTPSYMVGGTVSGLLGSGLVLQNNAGNDLSVSASGAFTFDAAIASGSGYNVTVLTQPSNPSQTCTVTNGAGTVGAANVTNISVSCTTNSFTVGGGVSGHNGTGLTLRLNGAVSTFVSGNGGFSFGTALSDGSSYSVTVFAQPSGQTCIVTNGNGTISGADIGNVVVTCANNTYSVGGTVTGLAGSGLILQNNAGNDLSVSASGAFTFGTAIASGSGYSVTVLTQPSNPSQTCTVANGVGTIGGANVTNVSVSCTTNAYTIGGTVSGLGAGKSVTLLRYGYYGPEVTLTVSANGTFAFGVAIQSGFTYDIRVLTQPAGQTCTVTNGTGTIGGANVTNISVTCTTNTYSVGGTVSGLLGTGLVLRNNGSDDLSVTGNGPFAFSVAVPDQQTYNVTVLTQPSGPTQICSVSNGSGTIRGGAVTSVFVSCGSSYSLDAVNDPLAIEQWHLRNTGQKAYADAAGVAGNDINANPVYENYGFGGAGVIAAVVDTGLEIAHEDLSANVVVDGSWDFASGDTDPTNTVETTGDHGTSVAGLIAAVRNNNVGGIGVASDAKLKGFNLLEDSTLANELASLGGSTANPNSSDVYVFNQSYGYNNTSDFPVDPTVEAQYASGVTTLRSGKGALFVKSAGNGFSGFNSASCGSANSAGLSCQNANFDPWNTIPYQIVVGATNAGGVKSSYSTAGSAIWVSAPGGQYGMNFSVAPGLPAPAYQPAMITTDQSGCSIGYAATGGSASGFDNGGAPNTSCNYTNTFNGTSSAAPVTSGAIALILQANPALTWRDVKHILATTARKVDAARPAVSIALSDGNYVAEPAWLTNAAGNNFHNWYGFGTVDASAAVEMARTYTLGQLGTFTNTGWIDSSMLALPIPDYSVTGASHSLIVPAGTVSMIEAVQIRVSAAHTWSGDLAIELNSPSGTRSVLKNGRDGFGSSVDLSNMVLQSNAFYGEPAAGTWTIKLVDTEGIDTGSLVGWAIRVYGH